MNVTRFPFFNAHHAPIGAFASFTFGCKGASGGLGLELAGPANESLYIGCSDSEDASLYRAFPFYGKRKDAEADFHQNTDPGDTTCARIVPFDDADVTRILGASIDEWTARDLTLKVISPVRPVPDPNSGPDSELADALCPAVLIELTLDNRGSERSRKVFIGYEGSDRSAAMRTIEDSGLVGVGQGLHTALFTGNDMTAGIAWNPLDIIEPSSPANLIFMLGSIGMLVGTVGAGERRTFRLAVCFHRAGTATAGLATRYLYNRWYGSVEEVASHAISRFDALLESAIVADRGLSEGLDPIRAVTVAAAIRSYYGATQLLERTSGAPLWIVNEGEYRMMNTADLMADQVFFELRMNPWAVRNELDFFSERYSYRDTVRFPDDPTQHPGGIAFTHDVGVANAFSRPGYSGYEKVGLTDCFSYMSCEELTNWVLTACVYASSTGDEAWVRSNLNLLEECLDSLCNRDDPVAANRTGVMGLDSSRCEGGAEITTYDSLDVSLGQARGNLYLAVKWWAAFVMLEALFRGHGRNGAGGLAALQAERSAATIVASAGRDGALPAVLGQANDARIIPVIEGLVFPFEAGMTDVLDPTGPYGEMIATLARHLRAVLVPGICKFADGSWKLSSTSDSSWLSKIYLCQHVAEEVFGIEDRASDRAHWSWLVDPDNIYFAWSDQMVCGKAMGSRYYPRGVTSVLWSGFRSLRSRDLDHENVSAMAM